MSIEVRKATTGDLQTWNSLVEKSPQVDLFHRHEALQVLADEAECQLHHLVGFKGQEPIGLFPVFDIKKGPFTTVFSPPPELSIPYLGPALLNMKKLKQRKCERRHQSFLEGCFDWIDDQLNPHYSHIRLNGKYPDLRPLKWEGFDTNTSYTYLVDLTPEEEELLQSFSSDARSNIRNGRDAEDISFQIGDRDALINIVKQVRQRYENQGIAFHLSNSFVTSLYDELPEGSIRPYVCRASGEFVGGIIAYEHGDTIHRWQGGVKPDSDIDISINDNLDWAVMKDAKSRGLSTYDLVGAENERINKYKAKFNPELHEYYTLERGSTPVNIAAHFYKQFRSSKFLSHK